MPENKNLVTRLRKTTERLKVAIGCRPAERIALLEALQDLTHRVEALEEFSIIMSESVADNSLDLHALQEVLDGTKTS